MTADVSCPGAAATALLMLVDALQCHYQRPKSCGMQVLMQAMLARAHVHLRAGVEGSYSKASCSQEAMKQGLIGVLQSAWPLMRFMSRLTIPQLIPGVSAGELCTSNKPLGLVWMIEERHKRYQALSA
eukprot:2337616-Amphidinium_carterae.1